MTVDKEKIINAFNNAWNRKIASENSYGKLASKEMFENKEEIIIDGVNIAGCEHSYVLSNKPYCGVDYEYIHNACENYPNCSYKQLKRLERENKELKKLKCKFKEYCTCDTERYRTALEEIRDYAQSQVKHYESTECIEAMCDWQDVVDGINEVLNENTKN